MVPCGDGADLGRIQEGPIDEEIAPQDQIQEQMFQLSLTRIGNSAQALGETASEQISSRI